MTRIQLDQDIRDTVFKGWTPPTMPTHREFAGSMRYTGGPQAGHRVNPSSDRCQSYLVDRLDEPHWDRIYLCAPPQLGGKTLFAVMLPSLLAAIKGGLPVGYGLPTLEDLDKAWEEKLKPEIKGSGYEEFMPKRGPSSMGGRGPVLIFVDPKTGETLGRWIFMAGGARGSTVALMVVDEADKLRDANGTPRWDDLEDMMHRADSYRGAARRIVTGTIEEDDIKKSIILPLVLEQGTGTRPWLKCPHCGRFQLVSWAQVEFDPTDEMTAEASAVMRCQHCPEAWDEAGRQHAIRDALFCHRGQDVSPAGEIVGPAPRTRNLGLIWGALESSLADLGELAKEYLRAQEALSNRQDHELMRKFFRYRLCRLYTADKEEREGGSDLTVPFLLERSQQCKRFGPTFWDSDRPDAMEKITGSRMATYTRHAVKKIPEDLTLATVGVDVQDNRVYWVLTGYQQDLTAYDLGWGEEYARADHEPWNKAELYAMLDRTALVVRSICGNDVPLELAGIDVGDGQHLEAITPWLAGRRPLWQATRGTTSKPKPMSTDIEGIAYWRDGAWLLQVDNLREIIHAAYRRPNYTPGAAHIPCGLSNQAQHTHYLKLLLGEMRVINQKTRKEQLVKLQLRTDYQDARRIAEAMARIAIKKHQLPPKLTFKVARPQDGRQFTQRQHLIGRSRRTNP